MCTVQRPILVVDGESCWVPVWVGRVAHIAIRRDGKRRVVRVCRSVVIRLVAAHAGVRRVVVVATDMAFSALIGNWYVRPSYWPDGIVVKSGRYPSRLRVAILTSSREARRFVVGVRRGVVIRQMAAHTSVWRVVVIAIVAFSALVRN